ncbi:MAG: lysine-2,3-aminomutase-like protein [Stellaceae bacterium]
MAKPLRSADALIAAGLVAAERRQEIAAVASRYAVAVTDGVANLIDRRDPADPVGRQYLPSREELQITSEERDDPIGDQRFSPVKGIVHRYPDRVLLMPHHACAVYCRFCFRREVVGPGSGALSPAELTAAIDYVRDNPGIWEVILSGGDPLLLAPRQLRSLLQTLDRIPHLGVVRIHTRLPMVDPARMTPALVAALATRKALWLAVHANHAREFGPEQKAALARLARAGIPLLGQSVLLRGVNDDAAALEALFRTMVANRVKPYYLHHPDLARGTGHFRLGIEEGQMLVDQLRGHVSGLCQPTYMLDLPGGYGKVPLTPGHAVPDPAGGAWRIRDAAGMTHRYPPPAEAD